MPDIQTALLSPSAQEVVTEAMPGMPVTPLVERVANAPTERVAPQQHDHAHSHGTFTHSHPHRHAATDAHSEGDAYRAMGTGEHSVHTHCKTCGADDALCGHGPRGGTTREADTLPTFDSAADSQRTRFAEALPLQARSIDPAHRTAIVQLMSVGPGNAKAGNYYTENFVRDVARLAPGRRMYVSHSGSADKDRGHRDPLAMASVIKEAWFDPGTQAALGKVRFLPTHPWLPTLLAEEPDAVQVSVEGMADGRPGEVGGTRYRCVAERMPAMDSADWVPEAGARGRFLRFAESAGDLSREESIEMLEGLTAQEVREHNPTLFAEIAQTGATATGSNDASTQRIVQEATAPLREELSRLYLERNQEQTASYVRESLAQTGLPATARTYLAGRFTQATIEAEGRYPTREALDQAITAEVTAYRGTLPAGGITGLGYGAPVAEAGSSTGAQPSGVQSAAQATSDILGDLMGVRRPAAQAQGAR